MSSLLAILSVPPFLSEGLTTPVDAALKPDAPFGPLVGLLDVPPPPPQADSTSAKAAELATNALVFNLTGFPSLWGTVARRANRRGCTSGGVRVVRPAVRLPAGLAVGPRVEGVPQPVTEQVERQHSDEDRQSGND